MPQSSFFWKLSFKPAFSLSSFTFIKKLFSSSLSAIRVVSSACLRLLIFLLAILISACALSSLAFCMMYSACKLNKQGGNIQPWRTPFPTWNQSIVPCSVLTCFFTCIQVSQDARKVVWYSYLFKNFSTICCDPHIKGFSVVLKQMFFCNSLAFSMIQWISDSSTFSKSSLNIWKFSVHILLKPSLENFEQYFANGFISIDKTFLFLSPLFHLFFLTF